jgi:hypothetical protein
MDTDHRNSSELDFAIFAWFFALAVLFQLARGDMGLFAALRDTPNGFTFGDGPVPQLWFCCALLTLVFPDSVLSLAVLALADVTDFWWRLPVVTPSIYFQTLIAAQVLVTAAVIAVRRKLRVAAGEFIEYFRKPLLALLVGLFFFAAFHKLTAAAHSESAGFFRLIAGYYAPWFPAWRIPNGIFWLATVTGEMAIALMLFFQGSRSLGLLLCIGFACFVGSTVYGFGAIVLAAVVPLVVPRLLFEPLTRVPWGRFILCRAAALRWRATSAFVLAAVFLVDHKHGFTLADRPGLFISGAKLQTRDVLTLMQWMWFMLSTTILACAILAALRHRSTLAAKLRPAPLAWLLPFYLILSEAGLYTGLRNYPSFGMFSGLTVKSCNPNHYIARDYLLRSGFHRDLLLVTDEHGNRIAIPALSLREKWRWSERHGTNDPLVDTYRHGMITRLRAGVEQPFDIETLKDLRPGTLFEILLPRRLFYLEPALASDLRCSMPELFASPKRSPQ